MQFAAVLPIGTALSTLVGVYGALRLRRGRMWPPLLWVVLVVGGLVAAGLVRAAETLVLQAIMGGNVAAAEGVRLALVCAILGPLTVLGTVAVVWPTLGRGLVADLDPPLGAAVAAAGCVIGRVLSMSLLERVGLGSGVRASLLALDEVAIAATWGYGLALSAFDGTPGGAPFGRYATLAMLLRGGVELAVRSPGPVSVSLSIAVAAIGLLFSGIGVVRLSSGGGDRPSSLALVGQEAIRDLARSQLRQGSVRPLWIVVGALANLGGILLGFVAAVVVGRKAGIDFGEIDRAGPAAEYAALLLALGVIFSFPMSAAVVGIASGGRNVREGAHVLEAGIAAVAALAACLAVLGVVAPVALAIGLACAPIAFVLAGLGAWIAAGRRM